MLVFVEIKIYFIIVSTKRVVIKWRIYMQKLKLYENKTLKLTNVLIKDILFDEIDSYHIEVEKMKNYLKCQGIMPVGPLVQYTKSMVNVEGQIEIDVKILIQTSNYINNLELSYKMESIINVKNCMYVRYQGEESNLNFAYDKIKLAAFEENIPLKGDSYTVFIDQNDDYILADIFMERAD